MSFFFPLLISHFQNFPFPLFDFLCPFHFAFLSFLFLPLSLPFLFLFNFFFTFSDLQTGSGETCLEWPMAHCCRVQAGTSQEWRVTSLTQSCTRKSTLSLRTKSLQSSWRYPTCSLSPCTASTSMPVTTRSTAAVPQLLCSLEPNQQVSKTNKPNSYPCQQNIQIPVILHCAYSMVFICICHPVYVNIN